MSSVVMIPAVPPKSSTTTAMIPRSSRIRERTRFAVTDSCTASIGRTRGSSASRGFAPSSRLAAARSLACTSPTIRSSDSR